jgi:hypothetical protein
MRCKFKTGDLVIPGDEWYRKRGIATQRTQIKMEGPMFWDEDECRAITVKWGTPGIVVGATPGGVLGPKRSSEDPNSLDVQVLFEGRVLHCDRERLNLMVRDSESQAHNAFAGL